RACLPLARHSFPTRRSSDLPSADSIKLELVSRTGTEPSAVGTENKVFAAANGSWRLRQPMSASSLDEIPEMDRIGTHQHRGHPRDRKSTRLNSSHVSISYAV